MDFPPDTFAFGDFAAIGISRGFELIAGFIYSGFDGHDIEVTVAAKDPSWTRNRTMLHACFAYPFLQLGCVRLTCSTSVNDPRATKLAHGLGFKLEGIKRRAYDGVNDAYIFGMLREECRWIKRQHS